MVEQNTDPTAMMDILIAAFDLSGKPKECPVAKMLTELPDEVQTLVQRLLNNKEISTRKIHRALANAGASVGRDALGDHREDRCRCSSKGTTK